MLTKLFAFALTLISLSGFSQAPEEVQWANLMDISFKDIYVEADDIYVYYPLFGQDQKKYDGKEITIKGYIIPIDVDLNQYVLSAFPFSACFFCGNAGPESVMAIYFKEEARTFKTDERLTLRGILELNDSDVDELVYVLRQAVPVE
jgi:hypothetical protein